MSTMEQCFRPISPPKLDEHGRCGAVPWWIDRMSSDVWSFGLMMTNGPVLCIERIDAVWQEVKTGELWVDCTLLRDKPYLKPDLTPILSFAAPTERLNISIQVRHVVAAFEMADT
jgi:hypothetical protein